VHLDPAALYGVGEPGLVLGGRALDLEDERPVDQTSAIADAALSDGRDNGLSGFAGSAIVYAQIETRRLRFDTGQYQRPAAFGARRPKVVGEFKLERINHGINQHFCDEDSQSFRKARIL
jgi:hypothetical protein